MNGLGPKAQRVYDSLRWRISTGELPPGSALPSYAALALEFGIAGMTVRQAIAQLAADGLVVRRQGAGTFVRSRQTPTVLVVDDNASIRQLLRLFIERPGVRVLAVAGPAAGIRALERDDSIALVLSDVRLPDPDAGIEFIRQVRRRWPQLPLAAITGYAGDLGVLRGSPEQPVLIINKPMRREQIEEALRLALPALPNRP